MNPQKNLLSSLPSELLCLIDVEIAKIAKLIEQPLAKPKAVWLLEKKCVLDATFIVENKCEQRRYVDSCAYVKCDAEEISYSQDNTVSRHWFATTHSEKAWFASAISGSVIANGYSSAFQSTNSVTMLLGASSALALLRERLSDLELAKRATLIFLDIIFVRLKEREAFLEAYLLSSLSLYLPMSQSADEGIDVSLSLRERCGVLLGRLKEKISAVSG